MAWKDKNGRALENEDTVIVEGKISGRHSSDRISVTIAPGQTVLIDGGICRKGKSKPEPEAEAEVAPAAGGDVAPAEGGDVEPAAGGDVEPAGGGEGEG
jgi:hypothetical protein